MTERFVFHPNPSVSTVLNALETPRGLAFINRTATEFASFVDVLNHTSQVGNTSVVHEPDGDNVALVGVSKREFARVGVAVTQALGLNLG